MNMTTKSKSNKQDSLLAAIQRKVPNQPESKPAADVVSSDVAAIEPEPRRKPVHNVSTVVIPKSRVGKPVQFWLHEEDRKLVRELAAWLSGQGERPTDSLVIRAALRTAKTGSELLDAYRQAAQLDGRLKQHKSA
jgi:hypothetical protein